MVGADVGYDFCFVEVGAQFSCCRMFGYHWSLVLQFGESDVFLDPGGDVMARLANIHLTTGTGDLVHTQFLITYNSIEPSLSHYFVSCVTGRVMGCYHNQGRENVCYKNWGTWSVSRSVSVMVKYFSL
jgi:hypothetical protein